MIEIAFCFDRKMVHPACVAIGSLLDNKQDEEIHYEISCICPEDTKQYREMLENVVKKRDKQSKIKFYPAPEKFGDAFEIRDISVSAYLRLLLHRILEDKDQVIYADVDVLFLDSLKGIWNRDISDALLAGVKGANNFQDKWKECIQRSYGKELQGLQGNYINSGILLMNLKAIRLENPDSRWLEMSKMQYHYQDQDILNITCREHIKYLDLRYNVFAHLTKKEFMRFAGEEICSESECTDAIEHPAVLHYTGPKPWKNRGVNRAKEWWSYVDLQEDLCRLFDKSRIPKWKTTGLAGKLNRHLPFKI